MSLEETLPVQGSATSTPRLREMIPKLASAIAGLDPGPVAALRRGPFAGAGSAAFWKLLTEYAPNEAARNEAGWAALVQAIAILTPKGRAAGKPSAHGRLPMGNALYNARLSEVRLARLLAATTALRRERTIRACRQLAAGEHHRFDLVTLAHFILFGDEQTTRTIAREYYSADASTRRESQDKETSNA